VVQYLVEKKVFNAKTLDRVISRSTPLHEAAKNGQLKVVKYLTAQGEGGNLTVKKPLGDTPLHEAARNGHLEVVKYLTAQNDNLTVKKPLGSTPLHEAAKNGHLKVVKYLVIQGGDLTAKNNSGDTPLHLAAFNGHLEVVKYLVIQGGDLITKRPLGDTSLHLAAFNGHLEVVKYLVIQGGDLTSKNDRGDTSFSLLCKSRLCDPKEANFFILNIIAKSLIAKKKLSLLESSNNRDLVRIYDILKNSGDNLNFIEALNNEEDSALATYMAISSYFLIGINSKLSGISKGASKKSEETLKEPDSFKDPLLELHHFQDILTEVLCRFATAGEIDEDAVELMCTVYNSSESAKKPFLANHKDKAFEFIYTIITKLITSRIEQNQLLLPDEYNFIKELAQHYLSIAENPSLTENDLAQHYLSIAQSPSITKDEIDQYYLLISQNPVITEAELSRHYLSISQNPVITEAELSQHYLPINKKPSITKAELRSMMEPILNEALQKEIEQDYFFNSGPLKHKKDMVKLKRATELSFSKPLKESSNDVSPVVGKYSLAKKPSN